MSDVSGPGKEKWPSRLPTATPSLTNIVPLPSNARRRDTRKAGHVAHQVGHGLSVAAATHPDPCLGVNSTMDVGGDLEEAFAYLVMLLREDEFRNGGHPLWRFITGYILDARPRR